MKPMMLCGHVANASQGGQPCCAICAPTPSSYTVSQTPDLSGREAQCSCGVKQPSSVKLAFFEYRGPGSKFAVDSCKCGFHIAAHEHDDKRVVPTSRVERGECKGFVARGGHDYDSYYCGHGGWD